jgi:hypothetical protein
MSRSRSLWACAALLAVTVVGLFTIHSDQPPDAGSRPKDIPAQDSEWGEEAEARQTACLHRIKAKRRIAQDVLAQRLTLLEAAEHFRDLNEGNPGVDWEVFRRAYPGCSDDERYCRQVIDVVEGEVHRDRSRAVAIRKRLEAELREHLKSGTLQLRQ